MYSMRQSPIEEGPVVTAGGNKETMSGDNPEGQSFQEQLRMLQDGKGRLCRLRSLVGYAMRILLMCIVYLGDSASLSYLDTIRRLVESITGSCSFTNDIHKGEFVEGSLSTSLRPTCVLPDREAAEFLLDSFFSNVSFDICPGECANYH